MMSCFATVSVVVAVVVLKIWFNSCKRTVDFALRRSSERQLQK